MKKKDILLLFIIFSISIIITYPAFPPSHALDSYCTMCNGYQETAIWFLRNGRVFAYLFYMFFNLIKLPYNSLGYLSVLVGNFILSYTILRLYKEMKNKNKFNKYYDYLILLTLFLLFYNPLYTSILLFDEAFIMDLGILFVVLSSIYLLRDSIKSYFISLFFLIMAVISYQGIMVYYPIIVLILILFDKDKINDIKYIFKKIFFVIINYGISYVGCYLLIKIVNKILKESTPKLGSFSFSSNINKIFNNLIPNSLKYLFGFVKVKYYYLLVICLIIISLIYIIKNNNKLSKILILIMIICSSIFVPFIPNIFMAESSNYTDARMALTLGIIPVILILYLIFSFKIEKKAFILISIFGIFTFFISAYSMHQDLKIDLKRYKNDMKYAVNIIGVINKYESENDIVVKNIYYAHDPDSVYYYSFGNPNGANIRVWAVDWAFECLLNASMNRKYLVKKMNDSKKEELFKDKEYDYFSNTQLVFEDDTLYLLIY